MIESKICNTTIGEVGPKAASAVMATLLKKMENVSASSADERTLLVVKWRDACAEEGWRTPDSLNMELLEVTSAGFYVDHTEEVLIICKGYSAGMILTYDKLPRSWITSIKEIYLGN